MTILEHRIMLAILVIYIISQSYTEQKISHNFQSRTVEKGEQGRTRTKQIFETSKKKQFQLFDQGFS